MSTIKTDRIYIVDILDAQDRFMASIEAILASPTKANVREAVRQAYLVAPLGDPQTVLETLRKLNLDVIEVTVSTSPVRSDRARLAP